MLNRLRRILTPWLDSVIVFLMAATAGYSVFWLVFKAVDIGWVSPNDSIPDGIDHGMVAFFAASTLTLALLNLALKHPPSYPLIVAGGMTMAFYLLLLLLLGMMYGTLLFNGAIAILSGLNILLIRCLLVRTTGDGSSSGRWARVALVAGSGLLLLYVSVPWSTGWLLLKTAAAKERAATATFGATYIAAKNILQTCAAFHHHIGGLVELTVSPHRGTLTDKPNYAIGSYSFNYIGQQSRGRVGISITQSKIAAPSPNESPTSADPTSTFTHGLISVFREGDDNSVQIRCDMYPKSRNSTSELTTIPGESEVL